jgi:hypothetical protein
MLRCGKVNGDCPDGAHVGGLARGRRAGPREELGHDDNDDQNERRGTDQSFFGSLFHEMRASAINAV